MAGQEGGSIVSIDDHIALEANIDDPIPRERFPVAPWIVRLGGTDEQDKDVLKAHDQTSEPKLKLDATCCPWSEFTICANGSTEEVNENMRAKCDNFQGDVEQWISQVAESFHFVVFVRELVGQSLFAFFGIFALPVLIPLYGCSRNALQNRAFLPSTRLLVICLMQYVICFLTFLVFVMYIYYQPDDVELAEIKFVVFVLLLRQGAIAIRYAYMTTEDYTQSLREALTSSRIRTSLLVFTWLKVTPITALFYAEISFVGVLGSTSQREALSLKFLPYAQNDKDLSELQTRMDVSCRRMILQPTGIARARSRFRKVERKQFGQDGGESISERPSLLRRTMTLVSRLTIKELSHKREDPAAPSSGFSHVSSKPSRLIWDAEKEDDMDPMDRKIFDLACVGGTIPVEDMFLFMIRSLIRSEEAHLKSSCVNWGVKLVGYVLVVSPCLTRAICGKAFFGSRFVSTVIIVSSWIVSAMAFQSVCSFIAIGGKDMWRRRALSRSCAALLTLQRFYRHGCLAEVDLLPILDLTDPNTIEAWRKLRQLCGNWGRTFLLRVQAFAAIFFLGTLLMTCDLLASLEIPYYMRANNVNLTHMALVGTLLLTMFGALGILVYLGQEVNNSSFRHAFLLQRQRLVIASQRHRSAYDAIVAEKELPVQDAKLARVTDLLDILAQDIMAEHGANPIKLLGMYCGYQLLSALYFLPAVLATSVARFCTAEDTWERCVSA